MEQRPTRKEIKNDMQGATKQHKKTKEEATIMLLIFKTLMASHKRVGVIVIVFYATFSNISDIS
jgi:hypothetical protein